MSQAPELPGRDLLRLPAPPPDRVIAYGDDPSQRGYLRCPPSRGSHAVVVFIHGGFWRAEFDLEHGGHLCAALTRDGFATWAIEYRRTGQPGGGWDGTFDDVGAAVEHLKEIAAECRLDLGRVALVGHSAGGHLAVWLASTLRGTDPKLRVRGVVSLAGIMDLEEADRLGLGDGAARDLLGGHAGEVPERYLAVSPMRLPPIGVRQVHLHGTADARVPFEMTRRFVEAARAAGDQVELVPLEGINHFEPIDPRTPVYAEVLAAVRRLLA